MTGSTSEKLEQWVERLGKDRTLPWVGLGLIRDLEEAVAELKKEREHEWIDL